MTYPQQGGGYGPQQQGGYGPPSGYPQPGGYGPHPPKKPNTGLIVGIVAAVVVAALGLVLVLVLTGDDDDKSAGGGGGAPPGSTLPGPDLDLTVDQDGGADSGPGGGADSGPDSGDSGGSGSGGAGSPGELALTVAQVIQDQDVDAIFDYACTSSAGHRFREDMEELEGLNATARPQAIEETSESTAEVTIKISVQGETVDYPIGMKLEDSTWCALHADQL